MRHVLKILVFVFIAFLAISGIASSKSRKIHKSIPFQSLTEDRAIAMLGKSPTFSRYVRTTGDTYACLTDSLTNEDAEIAVGQMHPDHFERIYSFRVMKNGTIFLCDVASQADDHWKIDYRP